MVQQIFPKSFLKTKNSTNRQKTVIISDFKQKISFDPEINFCNTHMHLTDAINIVVNEREPAPFPKSQSTNLDFSKTCPISRKPIIIPCRGKSCYHRNCFDLKQFLLLIGEQPFQCPFCQSQITQEDLRFDPYFFSYDFNKEVDSVINELIDIPALDIYDDIKPDSSEMNLGFNF